MDGCSAFEFECLLRRFKLQFGSTYLCLVVCARAESRSEKRRTRWSTGSFKRRNRSRLSGSFVVFETKRLTNVRRSHACSGSAHAPYVGCVNVQNWRRSSLLSMHHRACRLQQGTSSTRDEFRKSQSLFSERFRPRVFYLQDF